ncbi:hypothetical protein VF04_38025 [Nostoc linckia z7]|uniref:Uncharacterized protein n=1 Tax=Nostoc linckia z7 TaxID=1628745 RepID=A0ABX4KAV7_NOSLI|nr:hypothetical protein VF02_37720 [Nostoc linckia z1]PHJ59261.1 hypothetical protein VF05_32225 [Nostoc linckia z3]PHJ63655.1 hypothetical protein VF03_30095 [Nostoc linckia z2]PHJ73882.1 hypothetical protein VF06_35790 [Nostoc linckia z4]PHJ80155.1 hypothetical protein VF04_38025 [Nostoc linckia z7]
MYVDKELGELTREQANQLIEQYHDAIADDSAGQIQLIGGIEYRNSYLSRVGMCINVCRQVYHPDLIDALNQALKDGNVNYKYQPEEIDNEELDHIEALLKKVELRQKDLIRQYEKDSGKKSVVNWDWFIDACLSMSQVFAPQIINIGILTVKEFCLQYKRFSKAIKPAPPKTK